MAEQGKIPIPALPITEIQAKRIMISEWKKAVSEQKKVVSKQKKAVQSKAQSKTRVYIGTAYERWRLIKQAKALRSDADVAILLIDYYDCISKGPPSSIDVELESYMSDDDSSPLTPEECGFQTPRTPSPPHVSESLSDRYMSDDDSSPLTQEECGFQTPRTPTPSHVSSSLSDRSTHQLKLNDVHECYGDSVEVNTDDTTYIPAQSVLTESALSQDSPSINDVAKYIVDEYCLLELFEDCPECGSTCDVQKTPTGTFLAVQQLCPKCHFSRNWRSQRTEMAVPSGEAHSCTGDPETSNLKAHIRVHTGENPYQCQHCDKSFNHNVSLKSHIQRYHGQVPDPGEKVQMEKTSRNESEVEKDETIEMESSDVDAEEAEQSMEHHNIDDELPGEGPDGELDSGDHNSDLDYAPLEYHSSDSDSDSDDKHTDKKTLPLSALGKRKLCSECGAFFFSQTRKAHTCEYKKPYSCNVCGNRYLCEFTLKAHSKIHKDGYKHVCKYCLSTFTTRTDKLIHEQSHSFAEKPYQCPDCAEVFAKMRERHDHLLNHRGPKRHICLVCNMEFSNDNKLQRHVVVHTKVKQFVCEVCQRSFNQSSHLKSHMRVHTGEKPYQCQHCDKSFNHNVSLKSHIQRYHGHVPDPGENVQMEKTSRNESEAEKDVTQEMESSAVDAEEAEQSKDTLCNAENGAEEEAKQEDRCTNKYPRPTGLGYLDLPRGRPKNNAVITSVDANLLKRQICIGDENEEGQGSSDTADVEQEHDSDSDFDPAPAGQRSKKKGGAQSRKVRGRSRVKQK